MSKDVTLKELLQELAKERGFDFRGYKKTTLERRFRKRMFEVNQGSYADYAAYVRQHPEEISQLLNTILINVTEFFRDLPAWEILRHEILPMLSKPLKPGHSFRVWSAGCASGEEAYSIAILLAEHFGSRISEYDIKIYATDIDEEELNMARRGEYPMEAGERMRAEWRKKYFHGKGVLRVNREIRRLIIFGRGNLVQDAPISHVNLLICRNVLIYFDSELQKQILARLHYALEPGGILFLGKSESQLANSRQFRRVNARWRIFQRVNGAAAEKRPERQSFQPQNAASAARMGTDVNGLHLQHRYLIETLRNGVVLLGPNDSILQNNAVALTMVGLQAADLSGKKLEETAFQLSIPDLDHQLQLSRSKNEPIRFQSRIKLGRDEKLLEITIRPMVDARNERNGTLIYVEDLSLQEKLQSTVNELESTSAELQSTNEELETTNEELQSTNEELETTNEELQSTNEELETTNEELQSLNEELETMNQELEDRTKELDQVNSVYAQTFERLRLPVILVNEDRHIEFWNSTALRLFGFKNKPPMDVTIDQLPVSRELRNTLIRRIRTVLVKEAAVVARNQSLGGKHNAKADIHFSLIPKEDRSNNVLIMFEVRFLKN
jgi:two-component system, chemotaxis family, CheB/CheR fusion protein